MLLASIFFPPGQAVALGSASAIPWPADIPGTDGSPGCSASAPPPLYVEKGPEGQGEIEDQLRQLLEELKQLEKDAEEKFMKDILPYLKREIERLRKRLKQFSPGKEETPPPQRVQA